MSETEPLGKHANPNPNRFVRCSVSYINNVADIIPALAQFTSQPVMLKDSLWYLSDHHFIDADISEAINMTVYCCIIVIFTSVHHLQLEWKKGKGSPYSITEHRVPELIPVLGSQPAGDVSHKPGGTLPLLSTRPAVTIATLKRAATSFAAW